MQKITKHFRTFDSAIKLSYILRSKFNQGYYRYFGKRIISQLGKEVSDFSENEFFIHHIDHLLAIPNNFVASIQPGESSSIRSEANRSLENLFNLLGSGDKELNPIDWHTDFKTGFKWKPGIFYKDYIQEGINSNSDVKVPRELSRCHHFLKLGLAYQFTKDEKYASLCILQIEDWIKENPLMRSINWGCTMDVAIRAVNWIWALGLISGSGVLTSATISNIKVSLFEHGWFIYRNPEKGNICSHNHYLADLAGQIHLGLLFNQFEEPKKWLESGKKELFREIRMQLLPSGMSYERSTNYNRLVLELLLIPVLLLKRNGHEIPQDIWYRLEKMFEFIMYSLKPDGTTPIIGDQDDARLLPFGTESNNDYRYLLSLGALLFTRPDFKQSGNGFNIYCAILGGTDTEFHFKQLATSSITHSSVAYPDAGLYIMRKNNNYMAFNAMGKGLYPESSIGTHTHSDLLSFELFVKGKTFMLDPGSYVYTADAEQRMLFRSTKMHNTITVDGESQNVIRKEVLWDFERNAIPEVIFWKSDDSNDFIVGKHNGYKRLKQPVIHQRSITFNKEDITWLIEDELTGEGVHLFECFFHFDTGIDFSIIDNQVYTNCPDGNNILIQFTGTEKIHIRKEDSFVSKAYGEKQKSLVLIASFTSVCPTKIIIAISPILVYETNS